MSIGCAAILWHSFEIKGDSDNCSPNAKIEQMQMIYSVVIQTGAQLSEMLLLYERALPVLMPDTLGGARAWQHEWANYLRTITAAQKLNCIKVIMQASAHP